MPADSVEFRVDGLKELAKATDKIAREADPKMVQAADTIARTVLAGARGFALTRQQQLAASTLGKMGSGTIGSEWGGFAGSEFGGGMRPETKQFPAYRGKRGYFLYPSMRANASNLNKIWSDALDDVMKPWSNT